MFGNILSEKKFSALTPKCTDAPLDKQGNTFLHLCYIYKRYDLLSAMKIPTNYYKVKNKLGITPTQLKLYLSENEDSYPKIYLRDKQTDQLLEKKQLEQMFSFSYLNHLYFSSYSYFSYCIKKTNRQLLNEEVLQAAKWGSAMFEKEYKRGFFPNLLLKKVNPLVGYGVFAYEDIAQYNYIGEYTGKVRKRDRFRDKFNDYVFGFVACTKDTPYVVDAKDSGNITRFINHSDEPNLKSRWVVIDGICHIIFYANQFIPKGKQLTYDYGPYYWKKRAAPIDF